MKRKEEVRIIVNVLVSKCVAKDELKTYEAVEEALKAVRVEKWKKKKNGQLCHN